MLNLTLFFGIFGLELLASLVSTLLTYKMIDRVNAKRDDDSKLAYFGQSVFAVIREYRLSYPGGAYFRALILSTAFMMAFWIVLVYMLIAVAPKYALPSR